MVIGWGGVEGQTLTISNVHYYANNIYDNSGDGVVIYGRENATLDKIYIYNNFINSNNRNNNDYHLASASKAINAGVNLGFFEDDIDFEKRDDGAFDIGADEFKNK
jgi:hypothetical protein